jgi:hypothetical protein
MRISVFSRILVGLFLINGCSEKNETSFKGLWCNKFNQCISLNDTLAMIDRVFPSRYKLKDDELILEITSDSVLQYEYKIQSDKIYLKKEKEENWREFQKYERINTSNILEIDYSQESDYSKYSVKIVDKDSFLVEIVYDLRLESGNYRGRLGDFHSGHLRALIESVEMEVDETLNQTIISDIQEWALILKLKDEEKRLYYNYQGINSRHENFAFFMRYLTALIKIKGAKNETNSYIEFESKAFLNQERKRNLKLVN